MNRVLFVLGALGLTTAATATVPVLTPNLVLNEVLYDPSGADAGAEAVELANPGLADVDLSGWTLADDDLCRIGNATIAYSLPLSGTIPALGVRVVPIPAVGSVPKCLALANGGDVLTLRDPAGRTVDEVAWPRDGPADVREGTSIQRCFLLDGPSLATPGRFVAAPPTLGAENAPCA